MDAAVAEAPVTPKPKYVMPQVYAGEMVMHTRGATTCIALVTAAYGTAISILPFPRGLTSYPYDSVRHVSDPSRPPGDDRGTWDYSEYGKMIRGLKGDLATKALLDLAERLDKIEKDPLAALDIPAPAAAPKAAKKK